MISHSRLSEDEREQIAILRSRGAVNRGHCLGARSGENHDHQGAAEKCSPSGAYSPLHAGGAYQLRRRREAIHEREGLTEVFVSDGGAL
jgi:hypothetical protein